MAAYFVLSEIADTFKNRNFPTLRNPCGNIIGIFRKNTILAPVGFDDRGKGTKNALPFQFLCKFGLCNIGQRIGACGVVAACVKLYLSALVAAHGIPEFSAVCVICRKICIVVHSHNLH
jgi:hypothetical protein